MIHPCPGFEESCWLWCLGCWGQPAKSLDDWRVVFGKSFMTFTSHPQKAGSILQYLRHLGWKGSMCWCPRPFNSALCRAISWLESACIYAFYVPCCQTHTQIGCHPEGQFSVLQVSRHKSRWGWSNADLGNVACCRHPQDVNWSASSVRWQHRWGTHVQGELGKIRGDRSWDWMSTIWLSVVFYQFLRSREDLQSNGTRTTRPGRWTEVTRLLRWMGSEATWLWC